MVSCWEVRPFEALTSTSAHGFQKRSTVPTEKLVLRAIVFKWDRRDIQVLGYDTAVSMPFVMGEVASLISNFCVGSDQWLYSSTAYGRTALGLAVSEYPRTD